jgi:hypothetical protein
MMDLGSRNPLRSIEAVWKLKWGEVLDLDTWRGRYARAAVRWRLSLDTNHRGGVIGLAALHVS